MKQHFGGLPTARVSGILCLGLLLACGCGTTISHSTTTGSGGTSAGASAVSTGAQLGLVWNSSDSTLRSLYGVPGSTQLGPALFPTGAYVSGSFSAQTQTALLVDPKGNLEWMALPSLNPQIIAQQIPTGVSIAFSPRGAYAVVYAAGSASLLTLSGLPQQPTMQTVSSSAALLGAAISDNGTLLLAASAGHGNASITSTGSSGARTTLATLQGYGGMAFLPGSQDFVLSDSVANTLALMHNGSPTVLATHAAGLNQPFAVAVSQDDHWVIAADRADAKLLRIDLTGATPPAQSTCACSPNQLAALYGNAVFELAAPGAGPGWMIEADDPIARVLFIPPVRSGQ